MKLLLTGEVGLYSSWQWWSYIQAEVLLFQNCFLTGVGFEWGEVLLKNGVAFKTDEVIYLLKKKRQKHFA